MYVYVRDARGLAGLGAAKLVHERDVCSACRGIVAKGSTLNP